MFSGEGGGGDKRQRGAFTYVCVSEGENRYKLYFEMSTSYGMHNLCVSAMFTVLLGEILSITVFKEFWS